MLISGATPEIGDELAAVLGARLAGRWDEFVQHVPVELAERARAFVDERRADVVVSVGGGSATGLAKAIALTHRLPIVAVPTTYAGSEQTPIYGLTGDRNKQTGRDPIVKPVSVVYDTELTLVLPPEVTGPSAFNALAHSVEGMYATGHNPVTTALALEAIGAIARSLPVVMGRPDDLDARGELLYGAYLSGVVLGTTSAGLHHKLAHVLGGTYDLVHADAHSVLLPHVVGVQRARPARGVRSPRRRARRSRRRCRSGVVGAGVGEQRANCARRAEVAARGPRAVPGRSGDGRRPRRRRSAAESPPRRRGRPAGRPRSGLRRPSPGRAWTWRGDHADTIHAPRSSSCPASPSASARSRRSTISASRSRRVRRSGSSGPTAPARRPR